MSTRHSKIRYLRFTTLTAGRQQQIEDYIRQNNPNKKSACGRSGFWTVFSHGWVVKALTVYSATGPRRADISRLATYLLRHWKRRGLIDYDHIWQRWYFIDEQKPELEPSVMDMGEAEKVPGGPGIPDPNE